MQLAFATALKPLTSLTHLHLGVFLSEEDLVYAHIEHVLEEDEHAGMSYGPDECDVCDAVFQDVRTRELEASLIFAQRFKALKTVAWSSFFSQASGNDLDAKGEASEAEGEAERSRDPENDEHHRAVDLRNDRRTKIWILRKNGRVRVRRMPW